jgi:hypothetical protein
VRVLHRTILAVSLLLASWSIVAVAQDAGGRIVGTVTDPAGAGIADAKVTVTNLASRVRYEKLSDQDGYFQVPSLPIGAYDVIVEKASFATAAFRNQTL